MVIATDILPTLLERIGIGEETVSIGREADDRWCIIQEGSGRWVVFYLERGTRFDVSSFDDEESACYLLLGRMTLWQITRRKIQMAD
jgi:hypothetical protein